jgi:glycopeptide antibiotics resistance protein
MFRSDDGDPGFAGGARVLWLLFSIFVLYGTLIPFNIAPSRAVVISNISSISWIPLLDPDGSRASVPDIAQNILFFIPFGFLGALSLTQNRGGNRIRKTVILGLLLSATVELLQIFTIDRTTSLTDIATNATGCLIGSFAGNIVLRNSETLKSSTRFQTFRQDKYFVLTLISSFVVLAGALQPFDFTLDVGLIGPKVKSLLDDPASGTHRMPGDEGVVVFRFILSGYVWSIWLKKLKLIHFALSGLLISAFLGLTCEVSQIIVRSRMPGISDALIIVLGSAVGSLFAELPLSRVPRKIWIALTVLLTWVTAAIQVLSPFRLRDDFGGFNWVPFLPYYERTTFVALSNFIESSFIYFPLGFLLQYFFPRSQRNTVVITIALLTIFLSFSLEVGQAWVQGRYADVTDVLGAVSGALAGSWICWLWVTSFRRRNVQGTQIITGEKTLE